MRENEERICSVRYDYFDAETNTGAGIAPYGWEWPGKPWLRTWFGRDWTNTPVEVGLLGRQYTDDDMLHVGALRSLYWLDLDDTSVTNSGLVHLHGLEGLRMLGIVNSQYISDDGMVHLSKLHSLHALDLSSTPITDTGLQLLTDLESLQKLTLTETRISDRDEPPGREEVTLNCQMLLQTPSSSVIKR
jgi:hypothetical protein